MKRSSPPQRRKPVPRVSAKRLAREGTLYSTIAPSRKRVNRVNAARKAREYARCYHSEARVLFVQSLPCCVGMRGCGRSQNVHIVGDGASRKADYELIVPMCRTHHCVLHDVGVAPFQQRFCVDLAAVAAQTQAKWLVVQDFQELA